MATLSDENTQEIASYSKDLAQLLIRLGFRLILKGLDKRAERNLNKIEKNNPERIRTADIEADHIDKFRVLAHKEKVIAYEIDDKNFETPTLKYDIRDEHKITGIFKQIEEGYKIPENQLKSFFKENISMEKLTDLAKDIMPIHLVSFEEEIEKAENYQEEEVLNQDTKKEVEKTYDKAVTEVTGKENDVPLNIEEQETIEERIDRLKNQGQSQPPERTDIELTNDEIHLIINDLEENNILGQVDVRNIKTAIDNEERYFILSDNGKEYNIVTDYYSSVDPYGNEFKVVINKETQKANMFETDIASGDNWVMRETQKVKDKDYKVDKIKGIAKEKQQSKERVKQPVKTQEMER